MRWGRFFRDLVVQNIGTKIMALLLAIVLYVFVDQQGQETSQVGELTLHFVFDDTNASQYLLLDDQIKLTDLGLKGRREQVVPLARELNQLKRRTIVVTARVLQLVRDDFRIPLSIKLLRAAAILPDEVDIEGELPPAAIEFDTLVRRKMVLRLKRDRNKLTIPKDSNYVPDDGGELVAPRLERETTEVMLVGPQSAFRDDSSELLVELPSFPEVFKAFQAPEPTETVKADGIDWAGSGLQTGLTQHMKIDGEPAETFARNLRLQFNVRERLRPVTQTMDIVLIGELPKGRKLADYTFQGVGGSASTLTSSHLEQGKGPVRINRPGTVLLEQLEKLKLLVDLSAAEFYDEGDSLRVPAYLWMNPPDFDLLGRNLLVMDEGRFLLSYTKKP